MSRATSLQLRVHGLLIYAQSGECGVVDLVVRADKEHKGLIGRFRQHLANALFRAADACHPGQNGQALRVIKRHVGGAAVNDGVTNGGAVGVRQIWPIHTANGDAHYMALLVHEGVKRHYDGRPICGREAGACGQEGADYVHVSFPGKTVIVDQDGGAA